MDEAAAAVDFIEMEGRAPEAVLWDDARNRLLIVDNVDNRVWTWTDSRGLADEPFATLPLPDAVDALPDNVTLGQAALLKDRRLVVTRFGQPGGGPTGVGFGGVAFVRPDGSTGLVPDLEPSVKRLGVAESPDGTLYGTSFAPGMNGVSGVLNRIDLESGETLLAAGFGKLIGVVIADDRVYLSDQSAGKILDAPLDALPDQAADWHVFAEIAKPDQICLGPDGSLFSGQFQAAADSSEPIAVRRIAADGGVSVVKADPDVSKPSGVAYDAKHHRLFVADTGNLAHVGVHVFDVD